MVAHASLTDPEVHEPKGISTATAGTVYISDGLGSGSWAPFPYSLDAVMNDVSTANTIYIPIPFGGTVVKVVSVLQGPITTADDTITVRNSAGLSMGTLTIAFSGSAAGDVDILTPASNNVVSSDSYLTIESNGASGTAQLIRFAIYITRS